VSKGLFVAKASHIIWPFNRFSKINADIPNNRRFTPLNEVDEQTKEKLKHLFETKHCWSSYDYDDEGNYSDKKMLKKYYVDFSMK
jgi:hypothetical protein